MQAAQPRGRNPSNTARTTSSGSAASWPAVGTVRTAPLDDRVHGPGQQPGRDGGVDVGPHLPGVDRLADEVADRPRRTPGGAPAPTARCRCCPAPAAAASRRAARPAAPRPAGARCSATGPRRARVVAWRSPRIANSPSSARCSAARSRSSLPADMVVERRLGDPGGAGEVLHRRGVVAAGVELRHRHREQRVRVVDRAARPGLAAGPPVRGGTRNSGAGSALIAHPGGRARPELRERPFRAIGSPESAVRAEWRGGSGSGSAVIRHPRRSGAAWPGTPPPRRVVPGLPEPGLRRPLGGQHLVQRDTAPNASAFLISA